MINLHEKMRLLIALQDCDIQIENIRTKKEEGPGRVQRLEDSLMAMEKKVEEDLSELDAFRCDKRDVEQKIEDIQSRLDKSNGNLSNVKSNKEYQAVLKEVEDFENQRASLEDRVIESMEQIEALEARCAKSRAKVEEVKRQFKRDRNKIIKETKALAKDLAGLQKERESFCLTIDPGLLKKYDLLREIKGGIAVSPVIKGVCQTCHMSIPPQKFNELIRGDELMICPDCVRIIYWGEDERYLKNSNDR